MTTRNLIFHGVLALTALLVVVPSAAHAAYSLTQVHSRLFDPAYISSQAPAYDSYTATGFYYYASPTQSNAYTNYAGVTIQQFCSDTATSLGYTSATDFYCVYDSATTQWTVGNGDLGAGSGGTSPGFTTSIYNGHVRFYLTPPSTISYAQLSAQMLTVYNAWVNSGYGGTLPTSPDVCPLSEPYINLNTSQFGYGTVNTTMSPPETGCDIYHNAGTQNQAPTATLSANPASIVSGGASVLTYSCTNADSGSIDNGVGTITADGASHSKSVSPSSTTTYTLTCTKGGTSVTAQTTVTVATALTGSCSAAPASTSTGTPVAWSATVSGGTGTYSYSWSGTDSLSGSTQNISKTYSTTGTKSGMVNITSGTQTITVACSNTVAVSAPVAPALTCSVSNTNPPLNQSVTYSAGGATTPYTWTAADGGSYGTAGTASRTFTTAGNYAMTVSKSGYTSATCPTVTAGSGASCTNPAATLTANPTRIRPGNTSTISWSGISGTNTSCVVTGPGIAPQTIPATSCNASGGSVTTSALTTQSTYTITCDGTVVNTAVVNVVPLFQEF